MPSRRMIILGGLGTAGALVVGYALWPSHRLQRADKLAAKPGERFVANWIKIGPDNTVTVVVPHCDMGTGIFTALPQMAAEELDADWSTVRVEAAPPDELFANGALVEGFLLASRHMTGEQIPAFLRGTVDNTFRTIATFMDLQVTGGSSAVRATGVYGMRVAGAAAREMLVKAAAARWDVSTSECTTKSNRVFHAASGRSLGYGELAADAATFTPSSTPTLKPRSEYTLVGQPIPRVDIPRKVNGTTNYGLDVQAPGMAYAAIKISPVFGGKAESGLRGRCRENAGRAEDRPARRCGRGRGGSLLARAQCRRCAQSRIRQWREWQRHVRVDHRAPRGGVEKHRYQIRSQDRFRRGRAVVGASGRGDISGAVSGACHDGADERDRALQGRHARSVVGHTGRARRARLLRQDRQTFRWRR